MKKIKRLRLMFNRQRFVQSSKVRELGIPTMLISDLMRKGEIIRVGRGIYSTPKTYSSPEFSDYETLSMMIPNGVVCLISALRFHEITDENPHKITLALKHHSRSPVVEYPPVIFYFFSIPTFTAGVVEHKIGQAKIKVYSIEKTIVDCFKYRHKIGLNVAISALRSATQQKRINYNDLWEYAKICRVTNVLRPYMEAM